MVAGAVFIFFWYGCDFNTARKLSAEIDARVAEKTEPLRVDLAKLDSRLREVQIAKESAEAELAKHDAARKLTPVIRVKPFVDGSASYKDVREFTLETLVSNDGEVPVRVRAVSLNVLKGQATASTKDKIDRTQRLWEIEPYLNASQLPDEADASKEAQIAYDKLHQDCPHGLLFAIDPASKDVDWKKAEGLSTVRILDLDLSPGNSVSQIFAFVLTENLYHNASWYEFELTVELADHPSQVFRFLVPTGRQNETSGFRQVAKVVHETINGAPSDVRGFWGTRGSLAPTPSPK